MKRLTFVLSCLLLTTIVVFAGQWHKVAEGVAPISAQVMESDINRTVIHYQISGYSADQIEIEGVEYTLLQKLRKESMIEEKDYPRLPRVNRSIVIPDNGGMNYQVIASDYIEISDIDIAPSKGHLLRSVNPDEVPYTFGEVYQKDAFYPEHLVNLREPYILRDYRGMVVELNAFQYNPVTRTLRIYTDVTIEVKKDASFGLNELNRSEPLTAIHPQFLKIYQRHFLNFDLTDYPILLEDGSMLIICYDNFLSILEPLVDWKNQRGLPTTMVPLSQVGSSTGAIQNYIRNTYLSSDLVYVLLIGDAAQVPTFGGLDSDPVYTLIQGNDSYPEIFIGRFSAETQQQAYTQVQRTIDYEMSPQPGADWYHRGLGIASNQGPGHHGEYDDEHITLIAYKLLNYTYTIVDSVYDNWGTQSMITNRLNQGRSIINYCGHGSTTSWGTTGFNNGDVNDLVNSNMLPHIVSVACVNGSFVSSTCFAEAWLRATHDVTGEPTGAVGAYMSKRSQSWSPPMDMQDEGVDLMVADSMRTFGGICFNGSMLMIDLNGSSGEGEFKSWTIFGDPSLYLRNDEPISLTVTHDPVMFIGLSSFDVMVTSGAGPVAEATVCAMNEEFYVTGTTDNNGQVTLTFQNPPTLPGACTLTVFSWNATPSIETIDVIPPSGPYVIYDSYLIEDDLTGNGNGQLDYGEEVELTMTIENVGVEPAYDVSTTISSADPLVTIIDGEEDFGDIPAGATATIERAYSFEIDASVEEGHQVVFMLSASDGVNTWETNFIVTAHAPVVEFQSLLVDDQAGGNGNGNLDPGETADLIVQLFNSGSSYVEAVEALLSSGDPFITINTANAVYGDMNAGSSAEGTFNITVSQSCPQEYDVDFALNITGGLGYTNLTGFTTTVGDITFMPSGPDNFGYLAYDPNDAPELPVYDWVEISPDSGGFGTLIPFTSDDQAMQFPLPFTFQYYGVDYDTFSIGCNGWISMGINTVDDYSNSGIPNGDGPSAMIAPFWEDLSPQRPNSGRVWRWYDTAEHRFIIEYNHVEQYAPTGAFETFQVILYDPAHYTTASGDGRILFQYKDMSVTSATEGTVGIESPNQTDGIQYLFDGALDIHAMMVGDGMSILFTTATSTPTMTVSLTPASTPVIIPAAGGSFDYTIDITNDDTAPVFFDAWIEAELPSGSLYGVLLREGLSLAPNASIVRNMTQNVPASAPAGDYSYIAKTGDHPSTVFAEDSFPFEKLAGDNSSNNFNTWELTGWDGEEAVVVNTPVKYSLSQNYPNPFNPETTISFAIPNNGRVFLKIFNVLGEHVATLMDGELNAGYYQLNWRAEGLSSGMYFYKLEAPGFSSVKKMILMR